MKAKAARMRGESPPPEPEPTPDLDEGVGQLPPHLLWIWQAFAVLSRTRMVNQTGPQPISPRDLESYLNLEGIIDPGDRREVLHHVMLLDIEWCRVMHGRMEKQHADAKKEAEKKANKGRRK